MRCGETRAALEALRAFGAVGVSWAGVVAEKSRGREIEKSRSRKVGPPASAQLPLRAATSLCMLFGLAGLGRSTLRLHARLS